MNGVSFLQDLAIVMIVSGMVTLLFHRLKQPVILGYLLAGFIIGPNTPPFSFIRDTVTIQTMADLGVVFLMFSLGLDFSLRKLRQVGLVALLIAAFEILIMILAGYLLGSAFGWGKADALFLGIMLSLTSTMIVVKSLRDRGELGTRHAELVSGVSLFDDMFVILLMVALPGFARTGSLPTLDLILLLSGLFVFLVAAVVIGLLVVPRLLKYISRHATDETLLIVSLGLCFGLALFAVRLQFSAALGAFLIGAVVAEAREVGRVAKLMEPLRDMFCAVFFVAIGMQIDPRYLIPTLIPAVVITVVYLAIKIAACSLGAFLTGSDARTAMKFGTNMAQIGEFAFILATLGFHFNLTSDFLYPLIVTVASLNALLRPYLVDNAEALSLRIARYLPTPLASQFMVFRRQARLMAERPQKRSAMRLVWNLLFQIALNLALIAGGFLTAGYLSRTMPRIFEGIPWLSENHQSIWWLGSVIFLLPVYIATFRKMQAMAMMVSELMTAGLTERRRLSVLRTAISGIVLFVQLFVLAILTLIVSAALLPPALTLAVLLLVIGLLVYRYGRSFNRWYTQGKFALVSTLSEPPPRPEPPPRNLPVQLCDAHMETVVIVANTHEGRLIRELMLRTETGASIVALEREGKTVVNPGPDLELRVGDQLLLLGDGTQLAAAAALLSRPSEGLRPPLSS
ncbi:MAG TPA: cation:proton antiporter [Kiritimatiellia bacterium]|nr:cation:proton antiporter [Kiritimatiellia bacterium]HMP33897.1 cation:proton antiporter [Kiritimatiellia bacterium]